MEEDVLGGDLVSEGLAYDPQELLHGCPVDGGGDIRSPILSGLDEPIQLPCQAQATRDLLDLDACFLCGGLGFEEVLGFRLGGERSSGVLAGITIDHP